MLKTTICKRIFPDMHLKRWLTALVGIPIVILLIGPAPRWLFAAFLCLVAVVGLIEFNRVAAPESPRSIKWSGYALSVLFFAVAFAGQIHLLVAVIAFWAFVPLALAMFAVRSPGPEATADVGKGLLGPAYVTLPLAMLTIIDRYPHGNGWIFFLLTVVFAGDTGAFYCGKLLGKHKLYEAVSPNKTWEGAGGGLIFSVIGAMWFLHLWPLRPVDGGVLLLAALMSVSAQIGDLAESMLKRNRGVKDSSGILPGHGGLLDRIDGILFAVPVLYIYLTIRIL
ncbi:MAG: phosphatidate cytidylyltransferase [Deltaproteobacteria bacterium]|nr:phosphatidate cytidylyltransferase [Deltaproteobacteria bacterium]